MGTLIDAVALKRREAITAATDVARNAAAQFCRGTENVECPSLSPDNRLIAFKKHVGPGANGWRLAVLDVATMAERVLSAETRWVDDQVEWLDSAHVLYAVPRRTTSILDVWVAPVDGSAPARVFLSQAESPIVVR